ncbi:activating transcription factor 7-interacting protein 2 isoform X2 [Amphiprion ocellaris]|uniref:Activating transcription factor 7-interacting protein Fn3 domain-containing protein n=1 Tax=Amphiprion ocellaris TaxID=80972 RepID=A0A3Q1BAV1_AMPOC|nr:activating transcription factor 7-interacting protein 2 isoform X2 [Amphiprion ocellaris]
MSEVQDQTQGCSSFKRPAREKVNPSTKSKKRKRLSVSLQDKSRRVNIGMAFNRWRALKATKGLNSDAEVALCLLDVMKRLPSTSASTGTDGRIKISQSEVQALVKQEVRSAVRKHEARLQSLIETFQQLDNGLNCEKSIQNLEARINRVSKKAEAAISYVTKTQMKCPPPCSVNDDIISIDSEDESTETTSQNEKSRDSAARTGEVLKMMKTTKKALKEVHGFYEALTTATEDFKKNIPPVFTSHNGLECKESMKNQLKKSTRNAELKQEQPPPVCSRSRSHEYKKTIKKEPEESAGSEDLQKYHPPVHAPNDSPGWSGFVKVIKEEPEDPQTRENNNEKFEEPEAKKMKVEYVPSHTDGDTVQRGLSFPRLPDPTFPSVLSMEAASYSIPPKLEVQLALIKNPISLSVLWKLAEEVPSPPPMDSYTIFLTMEKTKGSGIFPDWKVLGEVKAIELPMCVLIRKHKPGHKVCAVVVGKDVFGRYGPYSAVATAAIPE